MDNTIDAGALFDRANASGERFARVAEAYGHGKCTLPEFFAASRCHSSDLAACGHAAESFATGIMTILTAFRKGFDPEDNAREYLTMLLGCAVYGALAERMAMESGNRFAVEHFEAIDAVLGPLTLASYRHLAGKAALAAEEAQPFESLQQWVDTEAEFAGKPITAYSAIDILYDIASRLAALGLVE